MCADRHADRSPPTRIPVVDRIPPVSLPIIAKNSTTPSNGLVHENIVLRRRYYRPVSGMFERCSTIRFWLSGTTSSHAEFFIDISDFKMACVDATTGDLHHKLSNNTFHLIEKRMT